MTGLNSRGSIGMLEMRSAESREPPMKKVEAIVRIFKLEDVKNALSAQGIHGMTITDVKGFGRQKGPHRNVSGHRIQGGVRSQGQDRGGRARRSLQTVVDTIMRTAQTGQIGDGKIFVSELHNTIRIRTGETGEQAI